MGDPRLEQHRAVWGRKPALRTIYQHYYERILDGCVPGRSLEIGGGPGNLKQYVPNLISTDILPADWLDVRADAEALPFRTSSFDNIILFDVVHHLERPGVFFDEAIRVLHTGARVVMVEPAITPLSYLFYKLLHQEPVNMRVNPLADRERSPTTDPFDSNQGIPTLLFGRLRSCFERRFPRLEVTSVRRLSLVAYPLSGGFKSWSLIPTRVVHRVLALEDRVERFLGPVMGFRLLVVLTMRG